MDFFKIGNGKIVEHWDVLRTSPMPPQAARTCSAADQLGSACLVSAARPYPPQRE
jgi:hypothetical protein